MSSTSAGSVRIALGNPPRKAKKPSTTSSRPPTIPSVTTNGDNDCADATSEDGGDSELSWSPDASPPVIRRGRKPGNTSLSRSAREAQRRENHSRIEKLRRTKINGALTTLRELVPLEYSRQKEMDTGLPEDDSNFTPSHSPKQTSAGTMKRPIKEKEFKLEILVKTVSFMQDLIARNQELEKQVSAYSSSEITHRSSNKRKSTTPECNSTGHDKKRLRLQTIDSPSLPSISEWLTESTTRPNTGASYLPTPPSPAQFTPTPSQLIPPLSLGPAVVRQMLPSPEEESAASMLLHIASRRSHHSNQAHTPSSIMGLDSLV